MGTNGNASGGNAPAAVTPPAFNYVACANGHISVANEVPDRNGPHVCDSCGMPVFASDKSGAFLRPKRTVIISVE